ncbi:MAG: hypothetical protein AcusKO_15160 [Acuticoccus sp.]
MTNGNIVVFYADNSDASPAEANGTDIVGQMYDPLGNPIGAEFRANGGFYADDEGNFDVAALDDGRFVVVYEDDDGTTVNIRATEWETDENGVTTQSTRTIVSDPAGDDTVRQPSVDSFDDGSYVVGYEYFDDSATNHSLRFKVVDAAGTLGAEITAVSGSDSASTDVDVAALSNGDIALVYDFDTTDDAIAYSVRTTDGLSGTGGAFVANTSSNGDVDFDASVVALEGGGFVVSWTNSDVNDLDIEFQRYDNAGVAQGSVVTVNSDGADDGNTESHLIALADGGFVVAYDDSEANNISFQRYNASGFQIGSRVVANNTFFFEFDPSGVGLEDGRFMVGWTDHVGGDQDVRAEIFDPRDAPNSPGAYTPDQWVIGTNGDDTFTPSGDAEFTHGWGGNDVITESGVTREYYGDHGDDTIIVTSPVNSDVHDGGTGTDTIDWLLASTVVDAIFDLDAGMVFDGAQSEVMSNFENLIGTTNNDTILGNNKANTLDGDDGNDSIEGAGGRDYLIGGEGNDTMDGGTGRDTMEGGNGNDHYYADLKGDTIVEALVGGGTDRAFASANYRIADGVENLTLIGNAADNLVGKGNSGDNSINGDDGDNRILGAGGDDTISGGLGDDRIEGEAGNDSLRGNSGDDAIFGGNGVDEINGGGGEDLINGGNSNDQLEGGTNADVFRFSANFGRDDILDFEDGLDRIHLRELRAFNGGVEIDFDQLLIVQQGADVRVELDFDENNVADSLDLDGNGTIDNVHIDIHNITVADLSAADFLL